MYDVQPIKVLSRVFNVKKSESLNSVTNSLNCFLSKEQKK